MTVDEAMPIVLDALDMQEYEAKLQAVELANATVIGSMFRG